MPRHQKKAGLASSALTKRWANRENLFSTLSTADTAAQTETAEKKSHGTQTETDSCVDIGTADEIVAFAADINQQLANLPVSIGMSDLDGSMTDRREVHTKQVQQILSRYSHDLRRQRLTRWWFQTQNLLLAISIFWWRHLRRKFAKSVM